MKNLCYLLKKGDQPATPANMGRRIGRTADPLEQGGRQAGARPKWTKSGQKHHAGNLEEAVAPPAD